MFRFSDDGITDEIADARRVSSYFMPIPAAKKKGKQLAFDTEWTRDRVEENTFINRVRARVAQWRTGRYVGVTKRWLRPLAVRERLDNDLDIVDIEQALLGGDILEQYPDDPRGESCLLLGFAGGKPVHVAVGWASRRAARRKMLRVITVYVPQLPKWVDPRTRGGRS